MEKLQINLLILFIPLFTVDLLLVPKWIKSKIKIKNSYYNFSVRYGGSRSKYLKIIFGLFVVASIIAPPGSADFLILLVIYFSFIFSMLYEVYLKSQHQRLDTLEFENKQLDCFYGILVYPFEYLNSQKKLHPVPNEQKTWSWSAFFIPEYWYFSRELLGAGYLAWLLLVPYMFFISLLGLPAIFIIIAIRILSGLFAERIFFSKYGKWA